MKNNRQNLILELIQNQEIETQEELAGELSRRGFHVTQATVSRDIRELHLSKVTNGRGGYIYRKPEKRVNAVNDRLIRILRESLIGASHAGHMIVVKTLSGSANVVAEAIDTLQWPEILGTIAGDNTVFIVVTNENVAAEVTERILSIAGETTGTT